VVVQLEAGLGGRLLLRSTHGLAPTEAGRNFYERAKKAVEEADEAELAARSAGATLSGRLRICAPVTFTRLHVMPRPPIFLAEHPSLDIDVVLEDRDIDLIAAGIDVALRIDRLADSAVTPRKIGGCRRIVVGAPPYFDARGIPQTPLTSRRITLYLRGACRRRNLGLPARKPPLPSAAVSGSALAGVFGRGSCRPRLCCRL
jgi:DNA-binding transcriptional LysR family regulator